MRRLPVNLMDLETALEFGGDDMAEGPQTSYLDLHTGQVLWVWESDEAYAVTLNADPQDNRTNREAVEAQPDRFVEVPELDPIDDNEMLRDFLSSDWTDDEQLWRRASEAYHGSIGRWKKAIHHDQTILHAWHAFEEQAIRRLALQFLAEHGIEPIDDNSGSSSSSSAG